MDRCAQDVHCVLSEQIQGFQEDPMQTNVHPVDEKLPLGRVTALGLQHVLVMYAGAVAVPR